MNEKSLSRREFLRMSALTAVGAALAACGPAPTPEVVKETVEAPVEQTVTVEKTAEEPREPFRVGGNATGVVYEMKDAVFGGEPIELVLWNWDPQRREFLERKLTEYGKMYPNVSFESVELPWQDYWTKLIAAVPAGQGPDLLAGGIEVRTQMMENNLSEPLPVELFDPAYFDENWMGSREYLKDIEGEQLYYIPSLMSANLLYINVAIWEEAGLTEKDYPKTWDDVLELGKQLAKYDDAGRLDVAGLAFRDTAWALADLIYPQGRYMFTKDGKAAQLDNPEFTKALEMLVRFYDERINSRDFLTWYEAFTTGKAAMAMSYAWFTSHMQGTYPDIPFVAIQLPTWTGENLPSIGRLSFDGGWAVNPNQSSERKAVSWDFVHWLYSSEDNLVDLAVASGGPPLYKKLWGDSRIAEHQDYATIISGAEYRIFPGEMPIEDALTQYVFGNLDAGTPLGQIIQEAQPASDAALQEKDWWIVERNYGHADRMIPDQP